MYPKPVSESWEYQLPTLKTGDFSRPDFWLPSTTYGDGQLLGISWWISHPPKTPIHLRLFQAVATSRHVLMPRTRLSDRRGLGGWGLGGGWVEELRSKKTTTSQNFAVLSRRELFILGSSELSVFFFLRQKLFFDCRCFFFNWNFCRRVQAAVVWTRIFFGKHSFNTASGELKIKRIEYFPVREFCRCTSHDGFPFGTNVFF